MINIDKYDSAETNPYILILLLQCNKHMSDKEREGLEWPPLPNRC